MFRVGGRLLLALGVLILGAGLVYWTFSPALDARDSKGSETSQTASPAGTPGPNDPILVGAGDIASCNQENDDQTAQLIDSVVAEATGEVVVFTAGDNAYEDGLIEEFEQCYDPTWGQHKARTRPALGNHEYHTGDPGGYFAYFGAAAGEPGKGYYSYDLGEWHIIVLNTNDHCVAVACAAGSPQEQWLRADLQAHPAYCTLAIWHDPLFSSGRTHGSSRYVRPFWAALYEYGADLTVNAHEHNYERFGPQTPDGLLDVQYGIREFVAGTGGESHHRAPIPFLAHSEKADDATYGVLKLTLHPTGYDWEFLPGEKGPDFHDSGSGSCHGAPTPP
jgi:Calcineurin-like phosphoesterase